MSFLGLFLVGAAPAVGAVDGKQHHQNDDNGQEDRGKAWTSRKVGQIRKSTLLGDNRKKHRSIGVAAIVPSSEYIHDRATIPPQEYGRNQSCPKTYID